MWSTPAVWKQYNKMAVFHFFLVNSTLTYILFSLIKSLYANLVKMLIIAIFSFWNLIFFAKIKYFIHALAQRRQIFEKLFWPQGIWQFKKIILQFRGGQGKKMRRMRLGKRIFYAQHLSVSARCSSFSRGKKSEFLSTIFHYRVSQ